MFLIFSKPGSSYQTDTARQQGSVGNTIVKENKTKKNDGLADRKSHERSQDIFANRTYDVIEPPEEQKFCQLNLDIIEKEASLAQEHIYESIEVYTRNTSSQTEGFVNEDFTEAGQFGKVFKEISCQTESSSECRRNKKRNSDTQEKDMATIGKTKECRLSSDSSISTQDSQESADSGHFSVRNPERSPRSPQSPYLWQPEGLNRDEVSKRGSKVSSGESCSLTFVKPQI